MQTVCMHAQARTVLSRRLSATSEERETARFASRLSLNSKEMSCALA